MSSSIVPADSEEKLGVRTFPSQGEASSLPINKSQRSEARVGKPYDAGTVYDWDGQAGGSTTWVSPSDKLVGPFLAEIRLLKEKNLDPVEKISEVSHVFRKHFGEYHSQWALWCFEVQSLGKELRIVEQRLEDKNSRSWNFYELEFHQGFSGFEEAPDEKEKIQLEKRLQELLSNLPNIPSERTPVRMEELGKNNWVCRHSGPLFHAAFKILDIESYPVYGRCLNEQRHAQYNGTHYFLFVPALTCIVETTSLGEQCYLPILSVSWHDQVALCQTRGSQYQFLKVIFPGEDPSREADLQAKVSFALTQTGMKRYEEFSPPIFPVQEDLLIIRNFQDAVTQHYSQSLAFETSPLKNISWGGFPQFTRTSSPRLSSSSPLKGMQLPRWK